MISHGAMHNERQCVLDCTLFGGLRWGSAHLFAQGEMHCIQLAMVASVRINLLLAHAYGIMFMSRWYKDQKAGSLHPLAIFTQVQA